MGIDRPDLFHLRSRKPQQAVFDPDDLLAHDEILKLHQKIVDLVHDPRRGILNGENGEIRPSLLNGTEGVPEAVHMEAADVFPEITDHRRLGKSALRSLKDHPCPVHIQLRHGDKGKPADVSLFRQDLVLQLPADGHELLEQLSRAGAVEIVMGHGLHRRDLLLFPHRVKHPFSRLDLVSCHLSGYFHPFLKQTDDLLIHSVDLRPQLLQIHSSSVPARPAGTAARLL